jgi:predicted RNase H-like HicB family nuclease
MSGDDLGDDELLAAMQAIFDSPQPPGGIGDGYRIEALRIVPSDDGFDDLEITVRVHRKVLPDRHVVSRLLFDRDWRIASGLDDPVSCAVHVVGRWQHSIVDPETSGGGRHRAAAETWVSDADASRQALLERLAAVYDDVREHDGVIEVTDTDEGVCHVHVTADQWRSVVVDSEIRARFDSGEDAATSGDGPSEAMGMLEELIDSRWDDEQHIVFFRGRLHQSIRAELPPVRRPQPDPEPPADGGWFAFAPDEDP